MAREAFESDGRTIDYRDVHEDQNYLDAMLEITEGVGVVPVIVDGQRVLIGFGGT